MCIGHLIFTVQTVELLAMGGSYRPSFTEAPPRALDDKSCPHPLALALTLFSLGLGMRNSSGGTHGRARGPRSAREGIVASLAAEVDIARSPRVASKVGEHDSRVAWWLGYRWRQ